MCVCVCLCVCVYVSVRFCTFLYVSVRFCVVQWGNLETCFRRVTGNAFAVLQGDNMFILWYTNVWVRTFSVRERRHRTLSYLLISFIIHGSDLLILEGLEGRCPRWLHPSGGLCSDFAQTLLRLFQISPVFYAFEDSATDWILCNARKLRKGNSSVSSRVYKCWLQSQSGSRRSSASRHLESVRWFVKICQDACQDVCQLAGIWVHWLWDGIAWCKWHNRSAFKILWSSQWNHGRGFGALRTCENMWEHVRTCENMWEHVRTCENTWQRSQNFWPLLALHDLLTPNTAKVFKDMDSVT